VNDNFKNQMAASFIKKFQMAAIFFELVGGVV
jgi:hypothetical protein